MASSEQLLLDAIISHQVDLAHYSNGAVRRMLALLLRADQDLMTRLAAALEGESATSLTAERLDALLRDVRMIQAAAVERSFGELKDEMQNLTGLEGNWQRDLFGNLAPPEAVTGLRGIDPRQVYAAALARPFQGRLLSEWAKTIEDATMERIRDAIRIGFVQNQTTDQVIRQLRGTRAANYEDGLLAIDRRNAAAVVRTALAHTADFARNAFYQANPDIIDGQVWMSTLDDRTTPACQERDQLEYTLEGEPIGHNVPFLGGPPIHWNCRSATAPLITGMNFDLKGNTRASMDGQVPASWSYKDWLKRQSATRQDEIMGPTRGRMLRRGDLTVDKFWNNKGRYLTIDELQQKNAEAFATSH